MQHSRASSSGSTDRSRAVIAAAHHALIALLSLLLGLLVAVPAAAQPGPRLQPGPRIVLVLDIRTPAALYQRLDAELTSLGFEVVPLPDPARATRQSLETAAKQQQAVAAMRLRASPGGVEVWVSDRTTGKTVLREVRLAASAQDVHAVVAVRAVELLRASLLELESDLPPRGDIPPPAAVKQLARGLKPPAASIRPPPPDDSGASAQWWLQPDDEQEQQDQPPCWRLGLAPAIGISPGGVGPLFHAEIDLTWFALPRFAAGLSLVTPTFPAHIERTIGSTRVTMGMLGIGGDFAVAEPDARFNARLGLGAALTWLHLDGEATAPYIEHTRNVFVAMPYVRVRGSILLTETLHLYAGARTGTALPRPVIHFAGTDVAHWGRPMALAALGVEAALD